MSRKPLPHRTTSLQRQEGGPTPSSSQESIGPRLGSAGRDRAPTPGSGQGPTPVDQRGLPIRQDSIRSAASSRYDDSLSTASPSYSSSQQSSAVGAPAPDRPRAGVLRTVGGPDESQGARATPDPSIGYSIPEIDFGHTRNYAGGPGARNLQGHQGHQAGRGMGSPPPPPHGSNQQQMSPSRKTPSPNRGRLGHERENSDDTIKRRSVIWHPGGAMAGASPPSAGPTMSPEQFVQQRAAAAARPLQPHQRQTSGETMDGRPLASPPLIRSGSADLLYSSGRQTPQDMYRPSSSQGTRPREPEYQGPRGPGLQPFNNFGGVPGGRQPGPGPQQGGGQYMRYPPQQQGPPGPGRGSQPYGSPSQQRDPNMGLPPRGASRHGQHPPGTAGRNVPPGQAPPRYHQPQQQPQMGGGPPSNFVSPAAAVFAQGGGWTKPPPRAQMGGDEAPPSPGAGRPPPQGQYATGVGQRGGGMGGMGYGQQI